MLISRFEYNTEKENKKKTGLFGIFQKKVDNDAPGKRNLIETSKEEIEKFQGSIGSKLREQYYKFLLKYNGGETPDTNWPENAAAILKVFTD